MHPARAARKGAVVAMDVNAQRIAIAKACGWKKIGDWLFEKDKKCRGKTNDGCLIFKDVPDYLADLNAMHEAEKTLPSEIHQRPNQTDYLITLQQVARFETEEGLMEPAWRSVNASAAERAEAFLRTIGKWVDSPLSPS